MIDNLSNAQSKMLLDELHFWNSVENKIGEYYIDNVRDLSVTRSFIQAVWQLKDIIMGKESSWAQSLPSVYDMDYHSICAFNRNQ